MEKNDNFYKELLKKYLLHINNLQDHLLLYNAELNVSIVTFTEEELKILTNLIN